MKVEVNEMKEQICAKIMKMSPGELWLNFDLVRIVYPKSKYWVEYIKRTKTFFRVRETKNLPW